VKKIESRNNLIGITSEVKELSFYNIFGPTSTMS